MLKFQPDHPESSRVLLENAIKNAGGTDIDKSQAQPGDIVFYDNNKSPNGIADHVEIIYSGTGESLLSIGGNTGSSSVSSAKVCSPRKISTNLFIVEVPA